MSYFFHPAAEAEYLESIAYYELKKPGLGALLLEEFEFLMKDVCENPKKYAIGEEPAIRRIVMHKFPFSILYREFFNSIQVLAVAHHRRRPQYWLGRF